MNYLTEILSFMDRVIVERPSTGQICLWHALMYICNKCGWKKNFTVSNSTLQLLTGLSRKGVYEAREALKAMGLIDFLPNGTRATTYTLHSACAFDMSESTQVATQDAAQSSAQDSTHITATLTKPNQGKGNETKNSVSRAKPARKKKGSKSSDREGTQSYAEYVYLKPAEYESLCTEYGSAGATRIIEILDNFKGSKGKEYIDDYRAIKNWVVNRWREEQPREGVYSPNTTRTLPSASSHKNNDDFFGKIGITI